MTKNVFSKCVSEKESRLEEKGGYEEQWKVGELKWVWEEEGIRLEEEGGFDD